jgi:hypothetical protein
MWYTNKLVRYVYIVHTPQAAWAIIDGLTGWKRVRPGSADGVTNLAVLLNAAKANNRKVDVDIVSDQIIRAVLK